MAIPDPADRKPLTTRLRNRAVILAVDLRRIALINVYGMTIGHGTRISMTAKLDKTNPHGIRIGSNSRIAFRAAVLAHDFINARHVVTTIGDNCFIGASAVIMPGVTIGDGSIVATGSVVMRDVPPRTLVAGNPALVVDTDVEVGRWGIRAAAPGTPTIEREPGPRRAPRDRTSVPDPATAWTREHAEHRVLTLVRDEVDDDVAVEPHCSLKALGIDSFGLITLRAVLEQERGAPFHDAGWGAIRTVGDLAALAASGTAEPPSSRPVTPSAPVVPAAGAGRRGYVIGMPQMAMGGLSEGWLCREAADLHWDVLTRGLGAVSSALADSEGNRLYATFTRLRIDLDGSVRDFEENEELTLSATASRFGAGMFFSDATLVGSCSGRISLMSSFSRRGEGGRNVGLLKAQPMIPEGCPIPAVGEIPAFARGYRDQRAAAVPEAIFETEYELQPPHDINGVGLLYVAAYPLITDICTARYLGREHYGLGTHTRDVFYFANCDPDETLVFRIHAVDTAGDRTRVESSLSRRSDGVRMAYTVTTKQPG